jgi:hypothetical protein
MEEILKEISTSACNIEETCLGVHNNLEYFEDKNNRLNFIVNAQKEVAILNQALGKLINTLK